MDRPSEVTLLKLGGSLLTEKTAVDAIRPAVLARLAAEIAESAGAAGTQGAAAGPEAGAAQTVGAPEAPAAPGAPGTPGTAAGPEAGAARTVGAPEAAVRPGAAGPRRAALVLAHGSGSFGHVAARRHGIAAGLHGAAQLPDRKSTRLNSSHT